MFTSFSKPLVSALTVYSCNVAAVTCVEVVDSLGISHKVIKRNSIETFANNQALIVEHHPAVLSNAISS